MYDPKASAEAIAATSNLSYDLNNTVFFKRDSSNFILPLTGQQLPALSNLGLLDIYLSKGHTVEPHWHPNAAELVYAIQGEFIVSVLNTYTMQLQTYRIKPPQVVFIPQGWWHWEIALTDHGHLLAIFDNSSFTTVFGAELLKKTPPGVFQLNYCINGEQLEQVLLPITEPVIIGPPPGCTITAAAANEKAPSTNSIQWRVGNQPSARNPF